MADPIDCKHGCGEKIAPANQNNHEKNDCLKFIVGCTAKEYFCDWKGSRSQLQDHVKECPYHAVTPMTKALKNEIQDLKTHNQSLKMQMDQQLNFIINKCTFPEHFFTPGQHYVLSNDNKKALKTAGSKLWDNVVLGNQRYSAGTHQWTIKSSGKSRIMVGVAPFDIYRNNVARYQKCGWFVFMPNSTLYSGPPMNFSNKPYIPHGSLVLEAKVTVKLDMGKKTISYIINGKEGGVAYENIPVDKPLCSCVMIRYHDSSVELAQ